MRLIANSQIPCYRICLICICLYLSNRKPRSGICLNTKKIILRNVSNKARQVSLTLVNNQVPLTVRERDADTQLRRYRPVTDSLFNEPLTIQPGEEVEVALGIDRKKIADNTEVEGLIKVTDDVGGYNSGGEYWIPVKASGVIR